MKHGRNDDSGQPRRLYSSGRRPLPRVSHSSMRARSRKAATERTSAAANIETERPQRASAAELPISELPMMPGNRPAVESARKKPNRMGVSPAT